MGKRYHCELCDKTFPDNPKGRKNHYQGVYHQQLKKQHYASFRDLTTVISEQLSTLPCRNFIHMGSCQFGNRCKYSHITTELLEELEKQVKKEKDFVEKKSAKKEPKLEEWLAKTQKLSSKEREEPFSDIVQPVIYEIPDIIAKIPNPPPSLLPPPPGIFKSDEDWG